MAALASLIQASKQDADHKQPFSGSRTSQRLAEHSVFPESDYRQRVLRLDSWISPPQRRGNRADLEFVQRAPRLREAA